MRARRACVSVLVVHALFAPCLPAAARGQAPETVLANPNTTAAGTLADGTLALRLEVREGWWRPQADGGGGVRIQAFGEAGRPLQNPGPLVRVRSGTHISVTVRNTLADEVVVHGLHTRPGDDADPLHVPPRGVASVSFDAGEPGTYYYWATTTGTPVEERAGVDSQLHGAFIIDPDDGPVQDDRIFVMGLWFQAGDTTAVEPHGDREIMVINGKSWPHTERLTYTVGDRVVWRWINPTSSSHPMHLHGFYFTVDEKGDAARRRIIPAADRTLVVTELMLPGATMNLEWTPEREGNWLFHCHFAFHVSDELYLARDAHGDHDHGGMSHSMAGLVLGIHVDPAPVAQATRVADRQVRQLRLLVEPRQRGPAGGPAYRYVLEDPAQPGEAPSGEAGSPTLVLLRDEPVAITIVNRLDEHTAVHWHGIELESFPDGVPGWSGTAGRTMPAIAPRDSFVAAFTPPRAGTFIYHSHANELAQMLGGLAAPLIVLDDAREMDAVHDLVFFVAPAAHDGDGIFFGTVNGARELPALQLTAGATYRLRFINLGDWRLLFTLLDDDGFSPVDMVAKDGADLPRPRRGPLNLLTGPGETADFVFTPAAGTYRLEFKQQLAGWIIPLEIRAANPRR